MLNCLNCGNIKYFLLATDKYREMNKGMPMKSTITILMFALFTLVGCPGPGVKKSSTPAPGVNPVVSPAYCTSNPNAYGCPAYCTQNPTVCSSSGTTTGTSTGGANPGPSYETIGPPSDNNWTAMYPNGVPTPSVPCPTPSGEGYDLRRGTITIAGGTQYSPANAWSSVGEAEYSGSSYTHNNSSFLVSTAKAKSFYDSDGKLKVRMKVRPQPKPPVGKSWCFNRVTGQSSNPYGYGKLSFTVSLRGVNQDGSLKPELEGNKYVSAQVGGCTATMDFSGDNQRHPYGVVLVVRDVQSDQGCWYSGGCTSDTTVKSGACWSMDVEAAVDGTKDI
ncbi:MAG TPA: hypothetical protein VNJ08_08195 [Bacteriovoracaceae bacterium]|nr:hypothetical protein [Bacteriovoracaceae bacterium]